MQPPKLVRFALKHKLTPGNILLVALSFWTTVVIIRGVIFWAVQHGQLPAIFVRGYHIHHFIAGFILLSVASFLLNHRVLSKYVWLALWGCGLGLIFDEFIFWTGGHFNYWSLINLCAVSIVGTGIVVAYVYNKRYDLEQKNKPRNFEDDGPKMFNALLPVIFIVLVLLLLFSYRNIAPVKAQKNPLPAVKAGNQSVDPGLAQ